MFNKAAFDVYSKRTTCEIKDIGKTLEKLYGSIYQTILSENKDIFGRPICFYYNYTENEVDLEAALPVNNKGAKAKTQKP